MITPIDFLTAIITRDFVVQQKSKITNPTSGILNQKTLFMIQGIDKVWLLFP
jgi:hypothetical protein